MTYLKNKKKLRKFYENFKKIGIRNCDTMASIIQIRSNITNFDGFKDTYVIFATSYFFKSFQKTLDFWYSER